VKTLYDQVGGEEAITVVVDELYRRLTTDPRVLHHFASTRVDRLKEEQRRWFRSVLGGSDESDRPDLSQAHRHLVITEEQVAAVLVHLDASLAKAGIDDDTRRKAMSLISRLWHARSF
jgi:hemoglobin